MAILSSIYAPFATEDNKFNLDKFVQAAILFEEIQLSNTSLVPQLIRAVGIDGFVQLLDEKVIRLVGGGPNAQGNYRSQLTDMPFSGPAPLAPSREDDL